MPRPEDWLGRAVIIGTDMYGGDTMGTLEEVSERGVVVRHEIVEVESESEPKLQSVFYPWTKVNWMYHPEE
jgi:hypothetical protein